MVGWHHRFDEHEFEQTLGARDAIHDMRSGMLRSMGSQRVGHD